MGDLIKNHFAYFLQCADGSFYAGWTKDLKVRLKSHNNGTGSKCTRARLPVKLVYWEAFATKEEAMKREAQFKRMNRSKKECLIRNWKPPEDFEIEKNEKEKGQRMKTIETTRLWLRQWNDDDAQDLYEYAKNPNVGPHASWKPHESIEESLEIIHTIFQENTWAMVEKKSGKVIGSIGFLLDKKRDEGLNVLEMGYSLSEDYWKKGLTTEAAFAAIGYAFEEMKLDMLTISRDPNNHRSGRVIEKCGFTYEGTLREANMVEFNREIRDVACYSMTKEEYESVKDIKFSSVYTTVTES